MNWDNLAIPWQVRSVVMILAGFVCLSLCAFLLAGIAIGLGVTGILLFLLELTTRPAGRT